MFGHHGIGFRRAVSGERSVSQRGATGENVKRRVDADFKMSSFGRVSGIGLRKSQNDL